jgi:hypothetical protein
MPESFNLSGCYRRMAEEVGKSRDLDSFIAKLVSACKKYLTIMGK